MTDRKPRAGRTLRLRRLCAAVVWAIMALVVLPASALAHADLLGASPGPGTTVARAPHLVRLQFSEDLDDALSTVEVWNARGNRVDEGLLRITHGNQMLIALNPRIGPGTYVVTWSAISADDGHATTGTYSFNVVRAGPLARAPGDHGQGRISGIAAVISRWIELTAGSLWLGLMTVSAFVIRPRVAPCQAAARSDLHAYARGFQVTPFILFTLLGASALTLLIEAHDVIPNWSRDVSPPVLNGLILHTPYGALWLVRQSLVLVALALWYTGQWIAPHSPPGDQPGHATPWGHDAIADYSLAVAVGYGLMLAASGHAASVTVGGGGILGAPVLLDWLHVLASGTWVGGIVVIVTILVPSRVPISPGDGNPWFLDRLDRFSPLAYGSVAVLAVTGAFNADVHLAGWSDLWLTVYGRALLTKLGILSAMFVLSAVTVTRVRPRLRRLLLRAGSSAALASEDRLLIRYLRISAGLGVALFLATAVMNTYPISGASPLAGTPEAPYHLLPVLSTQLL